MTDRQLILCATLALLSGCGLLAGEPDVPAPELCVAEPNVWARDLFTKPALRPGTALEVEARDYDDVTPCAARPLIAWARARSSAPEALRVVDLGGGRLRIEALAPGAAMITLEDGAGEEVLAHRITVAEPTRAYWSAGALDLHLLTQRAAQDSTMWLAYTLAAPSAPGATFYGADRPDAWQVTPPDAATVEAFAPAPHHFEGGERLVRVEVHARPGEVFTLKHALGDPLVFSVAPDAELAAVRATMHTDWRTTPDAPEIIVRPATKHRDVAPGRYRLVGGLQAHLYDRDGQRVHGVVDTRWTILEGQDNLRLITDTQGWQDRPDPPGRALTCARAGEGVLRVEARGVAARVQIIATPWP